MPAKLTPEFISAAIDGFEAQKARIDEKISELRGLLGGSDSVTSPTDEAQPRKRRKMSASARKRIGAAQRQRWAALRHNTEGESTAPQAEKPKQKRKLSAEGRKRIIEATKKRWAMARSAAKKASAPAKKATKKATKKTARKGTAKRAAAKTAAPAATAAE
jgi:hypothetical protein